MSSSLKALVRKSPLLRRVTRFFLGIFYFLFDSVVAHFVGLKQENKNEVLIIRLDNIGDFVLWQGQLQTLRQKYPSSSHRLVLVGNAVWTSLAHNAGVFDEIIPLQVERFSRSLAYRYAAIKQLRRRRFDAVIHPVFSRVFQSGDALVRISVSQEKIGIAGDCSNIDLFLKKLSDRWYSRLISIPETSISELEKNASFMRALGVQTEPRLAGFDLNAESFNSRSVPSTPYFVVFPGASWSGKRWPAENFAKLIELICNQTEWTCVICGSHTDKLIANEIRSHVNFDCIDLTGNTELLGLVGIISQSCMLISNDTSAAHIGPAVKTPTVCILGGGHFGRFLPYQGLDFYPKMQVVFEQMLCFGCNWQCKYPIRKSGAVKCIEEISVEAVWKCLNQLLVADENSDD